MKAKQFTLLLLVLLFSETGFGQPLDESKKSFKNDFDQVAAIYVKNLKPYALKFARSQFKEPEGDEHVKAEYTRLIDSRYRIYVIKAEASNDEHYKFLVKDYSDTMDKLYLANHFDFSYRFEFPGLDYNYFEACKKEVDELIKKEAQQKK